MKQPCRKLAVKSLAKVNLYLQVFNKRQDNFHNLSTLFARIDLADQIILKSRKDNLIRIKCNNPDVPADKSNLCWRAAELLRQECNLNFGLDISIKKNVPVGAGLGGGSSNAACVLLGLNRFWKLNLSGKMLARLGAKLGSDVPFFVYGVKFGLGSGRGDKIKPLPALNKIKLWFILIYPKVKVSTPRIYRRFDTFSRLTRPQYNVKILISKLAEKGAQTEQKYFFNSLEPVTSSLYPAVNQVKNAFSGIGLERVMMSGSGPAVFAVCDGFKQAKDLRNKLARKHKTWQVFVTSAV